MSIARKLPPQWRQSETSARRTRSKRHHAESPNSCPAPIIVITGAAGGTGLALAQVFAEWGATLILVDRDWPDLEIAADFLEAEGYFCDIVAEESVRSFARELEENWSRINILINVAGKGFVRSLGMKNISLALLPQLARTSGFPQIVNFAQPLAEIGDDIFPYAGSEQGFWDLANAVRRRAADTHVQITNRVEKFCDEKSIEAVARAIFEQARLKPPSC